MKAVAIKFLIEELKKLEKLKALKEIRTYFFQLIPEEFKVTVCLGCGARYEDGDCGCPAGSGERLRSDDEVTQLLLNWKG